MLNLFCQFLVVRTFERIQILSREKCSGCVNQYRFDTLHDCIKTGIQERVRLFFPAARDEVSQRLERLLQHFQRSFTLQQSPEIYLEVGEAFLNKLSSEQLTDRRFINEVSPRHNVLLINFENFYDKND